MALAVLIVGGIGGAIALKASQKPPEQPTTLVYPDAAPPPKPLGRNPDDDVPPPPPVEDAGQTDTKAASTAPKSNGVCDVKTCSGTNTPELEKALSFRATQARRCYNNALMQDSTLQGKVTVAVRVGPNGQVCSSGIASNEMGSQQVANCVAGFFRGVSFPAPKGGCVDVNVPMNFRTGQ